MNKKIQINCSRCKKIVDGLIGDINGKIYTAGFYDLDGFWADFRQHPSEKYICDECMFSDEKYIKIYEKK